MYLMNSIKDLPGFINIRTLVIVVIILVVLGLMGISVQHDIVENEGVQENTSYVLSGVVYVWDTYLVGPVDFLWNDVFVGIIWQAFIINMQRLIDGQTPTDFDSVDTSAIPSIPGLIDQYTQNN